MTLLSTTASSTARPPPSMAAALSSSGYSAARAALQGAKDFHALVMNKSMPADEANLSGRPGSSSERHWPGESQTPAAGTASVAAAADRMPPPLPSAQPAAAEIPAAPKHPLLSSTAPAADVAPAAMAQAAAAAAATAASATAASAARAGAVMAGTPVAAVVAATVATFPVEVSSLSQHPPWFALSAADRSAAAAEAMAAPMVEATPTGDILPGGEAAVAPGYFMRAPTSRPPSPSQLPPREDQLASQPAASSAVSFAPGAPGQSPAAGLALGLVSKTRARRWPPTGGELPTWAEESDDPEDPEATEATEASDSCTAWWQANPSAQPELPSAQPEQPPELRLQLWQASSPQPAALSQEVPQAARQTKFPAAAGGQLTVSVKEDTCSTVICCQAPLEWQGMLALPPCTSAAASAVAAKDLSHMLHVGFELSR